MATNIISNGSHWMGESEDTIEQLIAVLETQPLDPTFETCGNFVFTDDDPETHFFGNFYTVSHVFRLDTDDAALIERLTSLIRANKATEAYAQAKRERAADAEYWRNREEERRRALRAARGLPA